MPNAITPITPIRTTSDAADTFPRPPSPGAPDIKAKPLVHLHLVIPPPVHVPLVKATMGAMALEAVEAIQLLAAIPASLGPNIDTTA